MKKALAVLGFSIVSLAGVSAHAANTVLANATATVITPIAITRTADLRFGKFAAGTGGNVAIASDGSRTSTGTIILGMDIGGAASFTVTGDAGSTYAVTLPTTVTISGGTPAGVDMTVNSFVSSPSARLIGVGGTQTLAVGGTLLVAASQGVGNYTGTFDVTVNYN